MTAVSIRYPIGFDAELFTSATQRWHAQGMSTVPGRFLDALAQVYDPCCREKGISVVDMGLVHSVTLDRRHARVKLLLTSGWCPFAARVLDEVRERIEGLADVDTAEVEVVWTEAWTTDRLSASARRKLRFLPDPADVPDRAAYIAAHQPTDKGLRS
jgi:metal-sulfur cluster biosynthetic enzyme